MRTPRDSPKVSRLPRAVVLLNVAGEAKRKELVAVARPLLARPSMAAHAGLRAAGMVARDAAFLAERMGNLDSSAKKRGAR